jgi:hypothetical protein
VPDGDTDNVTLAEYQALRAEILTHTNVQQTLLGATITLSGVLAGFALQGHPEIVLILPVATLLMGAAYADETRKTYALANYIINVLAKRPNAERLKDWEHSDQRFGFAWLGSGAVQIVVFGAAPLAAWLYVLLEEESPSEGLWVALTALAAALCLVVVGLALGERPEKPPASVSNETELDALDA